MTLPGLTGIMAGVSGGGGSGLLYTLTVGTQTIAIGKDTTMSIHGFAVNDPTFGAFGSITPTTYFGFPITALNQPDAVLATYFEVYGDAHALAAVMTIDGAPQHLSVGTFNPISSHSVTVTIASPGVFTWNSHGMPNDRPVMFRTTGALPTGILPETVYYVVNRASNTFRVAATVGGSAINTSGTQSGTHTAYNYPVTSWQSDTSTPMPFVPATVTVSIS